MAVEKIDLAGTRPVGSTGGGMGQLLSPGADFALESVPVQQPSSSGGRNSSGRSTGKWVEGDEGCGVGCGGCCLCFCLSAWRVLGR